MKNGHIAKSLLGPRRRPKGLVLIVPFILNNTMSSTIIPFVHMKKFSGNRVAIECSSPTRFCQVAHLILTVTLGNAGGNGGTEALAALPR